MRASSLQQVYSSFEPLSLVWDARDEARAVPSEPVLELSMALHRFNYDLWNQEDIARRTDVADAVIRQVKSNIDRLNQQRNDAIERLDDWLLATYWRDTARPDAVVRTETPGGVIDRLSILSLKVLRMRQQTQRAEATLAHVETCRARLETLEQQQADLRAACSMLVADLNAGVVRMRVYRQFKMYNDPALNPQLYGRGRVPVGI